MQQIAKFGGKARKGFFDSLRRPRELSRGLLYMFKIFLYQLTDLPQERYSRFGSFFARDSYAALPVQWQV